MRWFKWFGKDYRIEYDGQDHCAYYRKPGLLRWYNEWCYIGHGANQDAAWARVDQHKERLVRLKREEAEKKSSMYVIYEYDRRKK